MRSTKVFVCGAALALLGCANSSGEDDSRHVPNVLSAGSGAGSGAQGLAGAPAMVGNGSAGTLGAAGMHAGATGGPGGTGVVAAAAGAGSGGGGTGAAGTSAGAGGLRGTSGSGATAGMPGTGGVSGMEGTDEGGIDGGEEEAPDPNGPCADLYLICFDIFDMWINPECATCNGGMGCQGCAIPFAY
jgi:hypothetical protein